MIFDKELSGTEELTPEDVYVSSNSIKISLTVLNEAGEIVKEINPKTGDNVTSYILIFVISLIGILFILWKLKKVKMMIIIVSVSIISVPSLIFASEKYTNEFKLTNNLKYELSFLSRAWKEKITENYTKIEVVREKEIPEDAVDVSRLENESVKAWIKDGVLYIGGRYRTYAPPNSSELFNIGSSLKSIHFGDNFRTNYVTDMSRMFLDNSNMLELDVNSFDTSNVTNMSVMFWGCKSLTELDLSSFNTSNVTNMFGMFFMGASGEKKLKELDLSNFNTSNVTDMSAMFYEFDSLEKLDISNFDTGKVTNMSEMFFNCRSLKELDVSSFNTSNVTNMSGMFQSCRSLKELDLSNFDVSNSTNMGSMLNNCTSLEKLNIDNWDLSNDAINYNYSILGENISLKEVSCKNWKIPENFEHWISRYWNGSAAPIEIIDVTNWDLSKTKSIQGLFADSTHLKEIKGLDTWDTSNITNMSSMFQNCRSLRELDLSNFNISKVISMKNMLSGCSNLVKLNMDNWNFSNSNASIGGGMLTGTTSLKEVSCKNWKIPENFEHWISRIWSGNSSPIEIIDVTNWDLSKTKSIQGLFADSTHLKEIKGLDTWDTSNITNMSSMFQNCRSLKELDLSNFNISKVISMKNMLSGCSNLVKVNMDNWNFSNSNSSIGGGMLAGTTSLKEVSCKNWKIPENFEHWISRIWSGNSSPIEIIDVTNWDLSKTKSIQGLFADSTHLKEIKGLDTWNTTNITNMSSMFQNCSSLQELDVSSFNTSNVTNMSGMFQNCSSLQELDLSNFNTLNVTSMITMLSGCSNLVKLNMDNWDFSNSNASIGGGMLAGTTSLKEVSCKNWKIPENFEHWISRIWSGNSSPIEIIDVTNWDLSKTKNIQGLFADSTHLKEIKGLDTWNTTNITNMSSMFQNCSSLKELDLSNFNILNVTESDGMFEEMLSRVDGTIIYVKNNDSQDFVLTTSGVPADWDTTNVIIAV